VTEGLQGQSATGRGLNVSLLRQVRQDTVIVGGIGDNDDAAKVLRRRPDHGGAADVDVLQGLLQGNPRLLNGLLKGIQVDGNDINQPDTVDVELVQVGLQVSPGQEPSVDLGVKRLYPAVQDLRGAGVIGNLNYLKPGVAEPPRRSSRGQDLDL